MSSLKKTSLLILTFLSIWTTLSAQDMSEGFQYLDSGAYDKASIYFQSILNEYPDNKTARICYARAIGLSGQAEKALNIFQEMKIVFPQDTEVLLNEAEALLWNDRSQKAIPVYRHVIELDSLNFTGHLGMANAYAGIKDYIMAQYYINRALIIEPQNPGALISYKFIQLGASSSHVQKQEYDKAEAVLLSLESEFQNDKDVAMAFFQLYINDGSHKKAMKTHDKYKEVFGQDTKYLTEGALIYHLNNKNHEAVQLAENALSSTLGNGEEELLSATLERYGQTLIWNKDTEKYDNFLSTYQSYNDSDWYNGLQAMYADLNVKPKTSMGYYKTLLEIDSISYGGLLGLSNAQITIDQPKQAISNINRAYNNYSNTPGINATIKKLNALVAPTIYIDYSILEDSGNNQATIQSTGITLPVSYKIQFLAHYNGRSTDQINDNTNASIQSIDLGLRYKWLPHLYTTIKAIPTQLTTTDEETSELLTEIKLEYKPRLLDQLELRFFTDILDYNTNLINAQITEQSFGASYNLFTRKKIGWYNQYLYSNFSDNNNRSILYSSLYYQWRIDPIFKTGLSFQWLSFDVNRPNVYFSPNNFTSQELFLEILQLDDVTKKNQVLYKLLVAGGQQKSDDLNSQATFRSEVSFGYKVNYGTEFKIYGSWSNVASAVASGFSYYQIGGRISHRFSKGFVKTTEADKK